MSDHVEAGALHAEGAAQFPGRQSSAVQTETMAAFFCGEAMREDPGQVFGRNTDSIVEN